MQKNYGRKLANHHNTVYKPVLEAFTEELLKNIHTHSPATIARNLVSHLVGNKDFYKSNEEKKQNRNTCL